MVVGRSRGVKYPTGMLSCLNNMVNSLVFPYSLFILNCKR